MLGMQTRQKLGRATLGLVCLTLASFTALTGLADASASVPAQNTRAEPFATLNIEQSDASVLKEVVRLIEPAITNFLTTYSFSQLNSTESQLELKYKSRRLSISWDISKDAKMFVVLVLSGKRSCYQVTGEYRAKLTKSSRCA